MSWPEKGTFVPFSGIDNEGNVDLATALKADQMDRACHFFRL